MPTLKQWNGANWIDITSPGIGTLINHEILLGRDSLDAHPITSITNLESTLTAKLSKIEFISLNDVTNFAVTPITTSDRIYKANLIDNGILTINVAGLSEYAICLIVLTSSGNGTFTLSLPSGIYWFNGSEKVVAPTTGQIIHLYIQSIDGNIFLTVTNWNTI